MIAFIGNHKFGHALFFLQAYLAIFVEIYTYTYIYTQMLIFYVEGRFVSGHLISLIW